MTEHKFSRTIADKRILMEALRCNRIQMSQFKFKKKRKQRQNESIYLQSVSGKYIYINDKINRQLNRQCLFRTNLFEWRHCCTAKLLHG